jgi:membrane-associated phospholipid phosphatase
MRKAFVLFMILCIFLPVSVCQNADIRLLREINLNRNISLDPAFRVVTHSAYPVCGLTPIIMFGAGYITKDSLLKRNAIVTGATLLTEVIIANVLKYSIYRTRPFDTYPDIEKATDADSPSFPSGHTASAFALATSLSLEYPRWYIIVPSYTYALAVAYSRLDLGVHYPSDVLAGAVIGAGSAFLCHWLNQKISTYRSCK